MFILFREFLFLLQKIILIIIISFVKIGPVDVIPQNNAFLYLIISLISYSFQIKYKPFITNELNNLNFKASLVMNLTVFLGLFMSISQDQILEIILLIILFLVNMWFIISLLKNYILIKVLSYDNSKLMNIIRKYIEKIWKNGN